MLKYGQKVETVDALNSLFQLISPLLSTVDVDQAAFEDLYRDKVFLTINSLVTKMKRRGRLEWCSTELINFCNS